jgi:hypothetical protein
VIAEATACIALDIGSATNASSLLGRVDGRWRLVGSLSAPSSIDPDVLVATLVARLRLADPDLAARLVVEGAADWPRLIARSGPPPLLAVLAATDRTLERLARAGRRSGWDVVGRSAQHTDPLEMTRLLLRRDVRTVLVGAFDPPAADERSVIGDLATLVAAAAERRPELSVVLAGAFADLLDRFTDVHQASEPIVAAPGTPAPPADEAGQDAQEAVGAGDQPADGEPAAIAEPADQPEPADDAAPTAIAARADRAERGSLIIAPAPSGGTPPDEPLRRLLDDLRAAPDDAHRGVVRATETLAGLLERHVETVGVGQSGGVRAVATPAGATGAAAASWVVAAEAALVPEVDEALVDRVLRWSTTTADRYRLRDRLAELRLAPWGEAHGDGAPLRLAVARAAVDRLTALTPELGRPVPDLVIATGGVWSVAPGPAVALALADTVRRPGASQLALDHAHLLAPLGTIADPGERGRLLRDLADDLLAPLGSLVLPSGLRPGRTAGRLVVHAATGTTELDLVPGGLELVDLPPGESAVAEFRFADNVTLGTRGRRFTVEVGGGLGGLLVDLRDVPLRLPDRPDRRRELLGAWQRALWVGLEA